MFRKPIVGLGVVALTAGLVIGFAPGVAGASGSPPSVNHVSPHHGPATGGTSVVVSGKNLTGATAVDFGTKRARNFSVKSRHLIVATSPSGTGVVDVTVRTPSGTSATRKSDEFTYSTKLPVVTKVVPHHGRPAGGTTVTIMGDYFAGTTAVDFGANAATAVSVSSGHELTAKSPAGTGVVDVTVTTPLGTSQTSRKDQFTYNSSLPAVTHVNPHRGTPAGGTAVTIKGSNLAGASAVDFGTNRATDVTVISNHLITATSPAGTGTVNVTVTTSGGTSLPDTGDQFTYTDVAPVVSRVSPHHGTPAGGTAVAITGHNFTGATAVDFGTNPATHVKVDSGKVITVRSPAGTGTVDITVTTPRGTSVTSSKDRFTYK
jgi:uncharacterized protein (AIM24 family)